MSSAEIPAKIGRYEIICVLGKGAMGVVYEGRDPHINRRVAIKTARKDVLESSGMAEEMLIRFLREAQAAGALTHPNIITIYDAGEEGDMAYIAMEYIEGHDLRHEIAHRHALDIADIVDIGANVAEALAAAHNNGVIHRDVKPANIMIPDKGELKVADFGIAHVSDSNLTQDGALIGTPHYMSPEQFMGHKLDGRSDLFSLGIILYELLTGEKPFAGEAMSTVMHHVIKTEPISPDELNYSVPGHVAKVVLKTLRKHPNERYADGRALAAALRESITESPDPAVLGFSPTEGVNTSSDDPTVISAAGVEDATIMSQDSCAEIPLVTGAPAIEVSAPPVPESSSPTASPPTIAELARDLPAMYPPPKADRRIFLAVGALATLVIAALGLYTMFGAGNTSQTQGPVVAPPVKHVAILVRAYYAESDDARQFNGILVPEDAEAFASTLLREEKAWPVVEGKIVAERAGAKGILIGEADVDEGGYADLSLPSDIDNVLFRLEGKTRDGRPVQDEILRRGEKNWRRAQTFVSSPASE